MFSIEENHLTGSPSEHQPQLSKPLQVVVNTVQDGKDRGQINVVILPDGTMKGAWKGEFFINKDVDFQVMSCGFKGLIDPEQDFSDEKGEDPTKLFFIAKGHFMILETNSKSGKVRNLMGEAYALREYLEDQGKRLEEVIRQICK